MKKRLVAAVILLVVFFLYRGADHLASRDETSSTDKHGNTSPSSAAEYNEESASLPTKVSNRPPSANTHATHGPEKLKEFFLPEVAIEGLPLQEALAKLRTAYEEVCRESGEVPVRLSFVIPPDATRPLTVKAGIRNLDASIRLLAAMAGLKVSRTGSEYDFTAPEETGEVVKKTFQIPPDFFSRASDADADPFAEGKPPTKTSPAEYFASKGLTLDPSTKFTRGVTTLQVESASAADQIAIEEMIDLDVNQTPLQAKMQTKLIKIPAGMDWSPPDDLSQSYHPGEIQLLMRQLSQLKGVELMTAPAVTARLGEDAKVEVINEVLVPSQTTPGEFEPQPAGVIVDLQSSPYGFGHHVDLNYSERIAEGESGTATAKVTERTAITDSSFSKDGNTRLHVQTLPDGSRSLVLVTPTLIDATGRPVREQEE